MTIAIAITGKSGSGKTTFVKAIVNTLHESFADKSVLLIDTDLTRELGSAFGIEVNNTIYDIRSGQYKYKTKLPESMSRQEFIEWALQDILVSLYDDVDLLVSGEVATKECTCYVDTQINEALVRLIKNYDFVVFDCEYDLPYLSKLVNYPLDITLIIADTSVSSVYCASKIKDSSYELASPGQLGVVLNKVKNRHIPENVSAILNEYDLGILGILPYDENLDLDEMGRNSEIISESAKQLLFRLNLPQF